MFKFDSAHKLLIGVGFSRERWCLNLKIFFTFAINFARYENLY